jgi:amino acid transporter
LATPEPASLKRSLGLGLLVLYGLGTIVGAGIYVLVGEVAAQAGMAAPLSFVIAGVLAAMTGLSYAELVARHPEAASAAVYVQHGFGRDWLSRLVGLALVAVAAIAAASIASGSVGYLGTFVPLPRDLAVVLIVLLFTAVAALGVVASVGAAVALTVIEIGGLIVVVAVGGWTLEGPGPAVEGLLPGGGAGWLGTVAGAFLAFFAFLGFEALANMAEETRDVGRTLPRAILVSIAISALLYATVSLVAVLAVPLDQLAASPAPLALVAARGGPGLAETISGIALLATTNGIIIEIVLIARLAYGMARHRWLPRWFAAVHPRTRIPLRATLCAGALIVVLAVAFPFVTLGVATSTVTLLIFIAVNLSLWRLQRRTPRPDIAIRAPRWLPPLAALACAVLIVAQVLV